ncbi:hypothetical protein [Gordonia sp. (in: high G+C Gram-positive bacteria)]|uniref:TA system antitoxin ParD family protein n=1 Tax=Gordonia sp. (in: high G+C Gram-positive bacteria) TaxID=84139 RepID=UPI003527533A
MSVADRVTRFSADLYDEAAQESRAQNRSVRQQLEHWARFGRRFAAETSPAFIEARAALEGRRPVEDLGDTASRIFDAELMARVEEDLAAVDFAAPERQAPTTIGTYETDADDRVFLTSASGERIYVGTTVNGTRSR